MPQIGQTATGPNGQKAVWDGQQWVEQASAPQQPPADPTFQYQGQKAQANAQEAAANANVATATVDAQIRLANAQAAAAQAGANKAIAETGVGGGLTVGQKKVDEEFAKEYSSMQASGGIADVRKQVGQLRDALTILGESDTITGPIIGRLPDFVQQAINPDAVNVREQVEEVVQRNLRLILGAQFTEKEGERLISRAFNPSMQEGENTKRVERLVEQMDTALDARESAIQYYESNGTLAGWTAPPQNTKPPQNTAPPQMGGGGAPAMQSAVGEAYSTPEDTAIAAAVRKAYMSGGSIRDMAQASRDAGREPTMDVVRGFADLIEYRDRTGKYKGQNTQPTGASVVPAKSGTRNLAEQALGSFASSPVGTLGIAAGNAASLGGLDEITGGINSVFTGRDYETERDVANFGKQASYDQNPKSALLGEILGAGGLGGLAAKAAPNAARAMVANGRRSAATGAGFGAVNGALENNDNRSGGALFGAGVGAAGGLFGNKVAAPAVEKLISSRPAQSLGRGVRSGINAIKPNAVKPQGLPDVSVPQKMAYDNIEDIGAVRSQLDSANELGLPFTLADASPKLRSLAGSVSRKSQDARQLAEQTFEPRGLDQAARAQTAIADNFAPPVDPRLRGQELTAAGSTEAAPFYNIANNRAAPINGNIDAYLSTQTGRDALKNAQRLAENEGRDPSAMGFDLDDLGNVSLAQKPSFETLDYVKRGIDDQIYAPSNMNAVTGELMDGSPAVRSLQKFRGNFVNELDNVNPAYPQARAAYAPYAKAKEALNLGTKGPSNRVKPRDIDRMTQGMPDMSLDEYRRGYATTLADQVDETRATSDPYKRIFGSTSQQQKIGQLFPEGAERFGKTYDMEQQMAATRYETLGGSPTAQRMAADDQFGSQALEMGADMAMDVAGSGGAISAARMLPRLAQWGRDASKMGIGKAAQKRANQLAPILFNTDEKVTTASLDQIEQYLKARSARKSKARQVGGLFGAATPILIE